MLVIFIFTYMHIMRGQYGVGIYRNAKWCIWFVGKKVIDDEEEGTITGQKIHLSRTQVG